MPNINQLFDSFPDYDVFTGRSTPPKKRRVRKRAVSVNAEEPIRPATDYGDGFGKIRDTSKRTPRQNYLTVFFFPFALIWLEFMLKFAVCDEFNIASPVYTLLFIIPFACTLTLICTFASEKINRILCNVFTALITLVFEFQLIYFGKYSAFFTFSGSKNGTLSPTDVLNSITNYLGWFLVLLVPFLFSVTVGRFVFTFRKIRVPAKISLALVIVLFQILSVTAVSFSKSSKNPKSSYRLYNTVFEAKPTQERFGLLETEYLDIKNSLT
ncbi:MAG: hypothetical protein IIU14_08170 [Ruminococcus sp.]|nr:hypothetical protein [Ruminococcus sp.]